MRYYDVFSKSMTPGYPEDKWYTKATKSMLCPGCITPLPVPGPIDVVLDPEPDNVPLNFVTGALIGFARKDFIEALGKSIQENFWLGKVYGAAGQEYSNFLTFRGKEVLFIRGNHKSTYRRCEVCGRHLYHPMGTRYLLTSDLTGAPIYESQFHQLIINEDLYNKIKGVKWKKLGIDELKILDEPVDGITFSD